MPLAAGQDKTGMPHPLLVEPDGQLLMSTEGPKRLETIELLLHKLVWAVCLANNLDPGDLPDDPIL